MDAHANPTEREAWYHKLQNVGGITKEDLNKLVMNFFVTEGYADVAENFQKESGTESEADSESIRIRVPIKKAVQCGDILGAIEKVNDMDPEILDTYPEISFNLHKQWFIELIRRGNIEEALEFAQMELAPRAEENQIFCEELEKAMTLLAYEDLSECPFSHLLDKSLIDERAIELDATILVSQNIEKVSKLRNITKTLLWIHQLLNEHHNYPHVNLYRLAAEEPTV